MATIYINILFAMAIRGVQKKKINSHPNGDSYLQMFRIGLKCPKILN